MGNSLRHTHRRLRELCLVAILITSAAACSGGHRLTPATSALSTAPFGVNWITPSGDADARTLARWRAGVGQPLSASSTQGAPAAVDGLTVISWNVALGAGDVTKLFEEIRRERPTHAVVLLLQEAFRSGDDIPRSPLNAAFAGRIRGISDREIDDVAKALDVWMYYVPSMRNGAPGLSNEDRGNAILSTVPLEDLAAIELPFERQRRVAVAATIRGTRRTGDAWSLRVASVHFDNMAGLSRGYIGGEYARIRQARGLRDVLQGSDPLILAGDFNTWFGFRDGAYTEISRAFPQTRVTDDRRTFMGLLRLDHVFYRLPSPWRAEFRRGESALGSDHYPLITTITF